MTRRRSHSTEMLQPEFEFRCFGPQSFPSEPLDRAAARNPPKTIFSLQQFPLYYTGLIANTSDNQTVCSLISHQTLSLSGDQRVDSLRRFVFLIPISSPRLSLSIPRNGNKNRHVYRRAQKCICLASVPHGVSSGAVSSAANLCSLAPPDMPPAGSSQTALLIFTVGTCGHQEGHVPRQAMSSGHGYRHTCSFPQGGWEQLCSS